MNVNRREFLHLFACAGAAGLLVPRTLRANSNGKSLYDIGQSGSVRLLHITDTHAQLLPIYFREPNVNIGIGAASGRPPHLVGTALLEHFSIAAGTDLANAFTYLDFAEASNRFGKVGGYAHLKTLVDKLRGEYGADKTLLLDGGDSWQGSGTSLWTRGKDMVQANNLLGVDIMTGHWEFTYTDKEVLANIEALDAEFLAQNVRVTEEALFDDAPAYNEDTGHAFKPFTIRERNGKRVAVIGQAFPYTPIANPGRFIPDWTFGIRAEEMQDLINSIRSDESPDAVVLLSHNGMDVDLKLAAVVSGIDLILGGHTHDAVPAPTVVANAGGKTWVTNAGSNGKYLAVADMVFDHAGFAGVDYKLLPVFANYLAADKDMAAFIEKTRAPYLDVLNEELAVTESLLYRRGNFNGSFDQLICDAQLQVGDAQIAFSPGFRWGVSLLPGSIITMDDLLTQTAITYPETYLREMRGEDIKLILEDVADNLFNPDPFYQQGGDMVRLGGMNYTLDPKQKIGSRISDMRLLSGELVDAAKNYKVAGWATVGSQSPGAAIWDVTAEYLRANSIVNIGQPLQPSLKKFSKNPGLES